MKLRSKIAVSILSAPFSLVATAFLFAIVSGFLNLIFMALGYGPITTFDHIPLFYSGFSLAIFVCVLVLIWSDSDE